VNQVHAADFADCLNKLRLGDNTEVAKFVVKYQPIIHRAVCIRIARVSPWSAADSDDVIQLVMIGFLTRLFEGKYELSCEEDLHKLLVAIAHKKILQLHRHEMAAKRCRAKTQSLSDLPEIAAGSAENARIPSMGVIVSRSNTVELLKQLSLRMSMHEMQLYRLRSHGVDWAEISKQLGEPASTLRKRLSRAIQRVASELKLVANEASCNPF
jgi:RNA polymerase sigma factor (sigma-70 family)